MKWYHDPMTLATVIIAGAAILNLIAAFLMWKTTKGYAETTRDIFEAAYKPHISITGLSPMCYQDERRVTFTVTVKNFGSIPAKNLSLSCIVKAGGEDHIKLAGLDEWALMPQESVTQTVLIHDPDVYQFLVKDAPVAFSVSYTGAKNQEYRYVQQAEYKGRQLFLKASAESQSPFI